jgi:hypothetical protein
MALVLGTPAFAADQPLLPPLLTKTAPVPNVEYFAPRPVAAWQVEFGARYWYGRAKTAKNLYDNPALSDGMDSRLTYSGLTTNAGEFFGRLAFTNGWFVKGYVGTGIVSQGHLQDEDFPPAATPYSSTTSNQNSGSLTYFSADVGYDVVRGGDFRIGAFAGYHFLNEVVNAYGCTQNAGNPDICQPSVPSEFQVITQYNKWQALRLGLDGSVRLGNRFTLSAEGAWLPYVHLSGDDGHLLRIGNAAGDFTGAIPETGNGQGYQFEALLSYDVTQYASIGVGARYWHMQANGVSHFENHIVGETAVAQPVAWKTDIYGVFLQGSLKFGPYPLTMH